MAHDINDENFYKLVLAFDTDEPEFARGFEVGRIWGLLSVLPDDETLRVYVSPLNVDMMSRIAESKKRNISLFEENSQTDNILFSEVCL